MNFTKVTVVIFISCTVAALSGCMNFSTGNDTLKGQTREQIASHIIRGKTTKEDLVRIYGEPFSKASQEDNTETWSWFYSKIKQDPLSAIPIVGLFVGSVKTDMASLNVSFNSNGVVKSFTSSAQGDTANTGLLNR